MGYELLLTMKLDRGYRRAIEDFNAGRYRYPTLANQAKNTANNLYQRALGLTNRFTATKPTQAATTVKPTPQVKPLTMMEKLAKIDAKNAQQAVVDGLRGTGPGVRNAPKLTVTPQSLTAAKPAAQSFLGTALKRSGIPLVAGVVDAGVDIVENKENPLVAAGRAIAGTTLGSLYAAPTALMADPGPTGAPSVMTAFGLGRQQGIEGFNKLMGIQPTTPTTGLPSNYSQTEADAFLAARRASGEVASLPLSAAIPGTGPEGNKVGQDYNTNKPGLQGSGDTEDPVPAASEFVGKEDEAMAIWAKANEELAAKVKPGQSGYEAIQKALGKKTEAEKYNEIETFKSTDEGVTNPADAAAALGNPNLKDAQTDPQNFLSNAIGKYNVNQQNGEPLVSMGSPLAAANYEGLSNLDAIGSYPTPDAENQVIPVSNMFDKEISRRGLNLRTGAR